MHFDIAVPHRDLERDRQRMEGLVDLREERKADSHRRPSSRNAPAPARNAQGSGGWPDNLQEKGGSRVPSK
jgi:hypothetical protein